MRRAAVLAGLLAAVSSVGLIGTSRAQEQATPPPKDTIFARKTLMDQISSNMDEVETMLAPGAKLETAEAREHLDAISVLLMAFPHLFPAATNQWKDGAVRDAALDTFAAPELWSKFQDFYGRATNASNTALDASRATRLVDFKAKVAELRTACDGCHAAYLKPDQ
jgi:cytochrome c556